MSYGKTTWTTPDSGTKQMNFSEEDVRYADMLSLFKKYSGNNFQVSALARRYGVCVRIIQYDLAILEHRGKIKREFCKTSGGKSLLSKIHYISDIKPESLRPLPRGSLNMEM